MNEQVIQKRPKKLMTKPMLFKDKILKNEQKLIKEPIIFKNNARSIYLQNQRSTSKKSIKLSDYLRLNSLNNSQSRAQKRKQNRQTKIDKNKTSVLSVTKNMKPKKLSESQSEFEQTEEFKTMMNQQNSSQNLLKGESNQQSVNYQNNREKNAQYIQIAQSQIRDKINHVNSRIHRVKKYVLQSKQIKQTYNDLVTMINIHHIIDEVVISGIRQIQEYQLSHHKKQQILKNISQSQIVDEPHFILMTPQKNQKSN